MKCPICKKDVDPADSWAPFCSERCKTIDLANWATEKYVISTPVTSQLPAPESEQEQEDEG